MQPDPQTQPDGTAGSVGAPEARPVPDEPGPRDVPDQQVIDKTLPVKPTDDAGRPG